MRPAIIFDLDVCLAPADEVGAHPYAPVFAAVRRANTGAVADEVLEHAFAECWRFPFDARRRVPRTQAARRERPDARLS